MPAKALLIAQRRNADHHRVAPLPVAEKRQGRRLATQLIFGIVQISQKLDFRHRDETVVCKADGKAQNALLIQQRVDHTRRAKPRMQLLRDTVVAAFAAHIFAHQQGFRITQHYVVQRPVDQPRHWLRLVHLRRVTAKDL